MKKITSLLILLTLTACASIHEAPENDDRDAKKFAPVDGKAVVYVFRDETFGAALSKTVTINHKQLGTTGPHSYFRAVVEPGICSIESGDVESKLDVTAKSGDVLYIWQEMKMGAFSGSTALSRVSAERGKQGVRDSRMIQSN